MLAIPLSKRAIDVVIEPLDPAVQQAVSRIKMRDPTLLARVHKIIVHPGGGAELGHVESGPGKNPQEIHLFKGRIEQMIRQQMSANGTQPTPADFTQALERAIVETIGHEAGHIGPERSPDQLRTQPFLGEPQAETKAKETIQKIYPGALIHAALELDNIRHKFLPDCPMDEPDVSFMAYVAAENMVKALRCGLQILRHGSVPAALALDEAAMFNGLAVRRTSIAKQLGALVGMFGALPNSIEFATQLATWQAKNDLAPNGKLDHPTIAHIRSRIMFCEDFPRNFGIVSKGLYRGRQPDNIEQLAALRDKLGVRHVVTLNDDLPPIADWCRQLGLRHTHAILASGKSDELGWKTLGINLSPCLLDVPTFVHCRHGADRTGGVIARFRTENGWPCDLAYVEAKAFGLKDRFPDFIDRFTETCQHDPKCHRHPPIDTVAIRRVMEEACKNNPECISPPVEQNLLEPTPSDIHYTTDSMTYDSGADTILSPFSIRSIPVSPGGGR
jgi:hypothetical protein